MPYFILWFNVLRFAKIAEPLFKGKPMEAAFSKKRLRQLRQLLHEYATLDLQEDELYEAATSIVRFVAGRLLRDASKESEV